ncbi:MAG: two-component regulator propeller domain-containing protein [Balneola sp.]
MLAYLVAILAFFQVQNLSIDYYNTQKGLSNNIVYDVLQDRQGFIWIATENGLNRFDAYTFKTFYHSEQDSKTISSNVVRSIFESKDGRLWIGTRQGINLFNRKTESFTRFSPPDSLNIFSNDVLEIESDSEENLWYLNHSRLFKFDIENEVYEEVRAPFVIYNFRIMEGDIIWISSDEGDIYTFNISTKEFQKIRQLDTEDHISFFSGRDKQTIFYNTFDGSLTLDGWERLLLLDGNNKVERFFEDSEGRKWFGSKEHIYMQENERTGIIKLSLGESKEPVLSTIKAISEDKDGGIWIGTVDGLYRIKNKEKNFRRIQNGYAGQAVMAIEESENTWWVNYFSENLKKYKFNNSGELVEESYINLESGVNQIWDIQEIGCKKLWLATEAGLFELDKDSYKISRIEVFEEEREYEVFFVIKEDAAGTFWAGGYSSVLKIDSRTNEVLTRIEIVDEYEGALVQDIMPVEDGLLIATETHGLFHYSEATGLSKKWNQKTIPLQLDQVSIWDMYQSSDEKVWFAGNNGLYSINSYDELSHPIKSQIEDNLIVFSITQDHNQLLWLGTDKGLVRYNPITKEYRRFDSGDGFENPEFNRRSIFTSRSGEVVVGGMSGLMYFNSDEIRINQKEPEVWITNFNIITPDSAKEVITYQIEEIDLEWHQNTFEINFTALNYTNSSENRYKYKLVNYDPDWVEPEESRFARYVRVPAGQYEFKVIASNNDGIWNETGDSVQIRINPPFWQTYWFRALLLIVVITLAWMLYRFRVRQLLEVERVRLRIAGDLHDEIGSGLSGIALTGDLLQDQVKEGNPKPEMIQKISGNARSLASSLDSIVWLIDPSKESLLDLLIRCKQVARDLLSNCDLVVLDEIPESLHNKELSSEVRRGFYLIFKEAAHNIYKHAKAEKVQIRFYLEGDTLAISLQDNGIGFDEEKVLKGKGLDNFRKRADEIRGSFSLKSEEGKGTTIIIQKALP